MDVKAVEHQGVPLLMKGKCHFQRNQLLLGLHRCCCDGVWVLKHPQTLVMGVLTGMLFS